MKYAREILRGVEGYVPGEQPKMPGMVKLNTNENPYPPSPRVLQALREVSTETIRKYPDPVSLALRSAVAERYGYAGPEWVVAGNGMDDVLAMTIRAFVDPGDTIASPYPTYTLYETLSALHGAVFKYVQLDGEYFLPEEIYETKARVIFVPRPNAPTGTTSPLKSIERLCKSFPGIVFVDEAYVDFAEDSCIDFPKEFENVIIGRTFSKAYALCGLRLGYAVARPELIAEFMKVRDSYNVNAIAQAGGLAAFGDEAYLEATVKRIKKNREWLTSALTDMGFWVPESRANFVLAHRKRAPFARDIFQALRERAIIVRYFDAPRLQDALRITVGSEAEIEKLIDALREILTPSSGNGSVLD